MPGLTMCAPVCQCPVSFRAVLRVSGVLQSDGCRLSQLRCHTAKSGHIYNKFSWGNRKSLFDEPKAKGVAVRDELVQYYRCTFLGLNLANVRSLVHVSAAVHLF